VHNRGIAASLMADSVVRAVNERLCTGCGACVVACPRNAIAMVEDCVGRMHPSISQERCTRCGRCWRTCGGRGVRLDLPNSTDPFIGTILASYTGFAADKDLRAAGQSGGLVGAILAYMLESGEADAVMSAISNDDGSFKPRAVAVRSREGVIAGQGSKYCPVPINTILNECRSHDRIVCVGVGCQIHGLHNLYASGLPELPEVPLRIGLICDRTLSFLAVDVMARDSGLQEHDYVGIEYRSKSRSGWPGEVCFHLNGGGLLYAGSKVRTRLKDYVTPARCRACFDKMNSLADLTVGDPWGGLPIVSEGTSVVIVRTERGRRILEAAEAAGYAAIRPIGVESVLFGQAVQQRARDIATHRRLSRRLGWAIPEVEGLEDWLPTNYRPFAVLALGWRLFMAHRVETSVSREQSLSRIQRLRRIDRTITGTIRVMSWPLRRLMAVVSPDARAGRGTKP